jgi:hypothetical protein
MITRAVFERYHLTKIKDAWGYFANAAAATGIPAAVLAAIASRETGVRMIVGDGGHGRGVMQIDDRYHSAFTSSPAAMDWTQNPMYGAKVLASYLQQAISGGVDEFNALRVALAGYNQGLSGAKADYQNYGDPDKTTTGGDYSKDVLQRAEWIEENIPAAAAGSKKNCGGG